MEIKMTREALDHIVQQAMFLGQVQYMTMIAPESDKMKEREAKRYLKNLGYSPSILQKLVDAKLVSRHKDGDRNSAVYYSRKEIQRQIAVTEMHKGDIKICI